MKNEIKKLSRTAISLNGNYVIKTEPPIITLSQILTRKITKGSMPFKNEKAIYSENSTYFDDVHVEKQFLILKEIKNSRTLLTTDLKSSTIIRIYNSLSSLQYHTKFNYFESVLFFFINGIFPRLLRDLRKTRYFTFPEKCSIIIQLLKLIRNPYVLPTSGRFIHNDMMLHNILVSDDKFHIIDFEDAILEKKWVYTDFFDLFYQRHDSKLEDMDEATTLLRKMLGEFYCDCNEKELDELKPHAILGFIRFHVRRTIMTRADKTQKDRSRMLIKEFLLRTNVF